METSTGPTAEFTLVRPEDLAWRPSNLMKVPNADFLERTGSEWLGARLWRFPPGSANTLHRHRRAEEFYFVIEGVGRIRVDGQTITVPRQGGIHVRPAALRQVFNDTPDEVLWLIVSGPDREFDPGEPRDMSVFYPVDPTQLPEELRGTAWPPPDAPPSP